MKVFTIGEVAKICKVAPRTVSKWFDSGRLKGYRIPGSQDRRIPREYLIKFLKEHGTDMPLGVLELSALADEMRGDLEEWGEKMPAYHRGFVAGVCTADAIIQGKSDAGGGR